MQWCHSEPTIADMLSDPIIRALMTADRVVPDELERNLREIAGALRGPGCAKTRRPNPPRSRNATLARGSFNKAHGTPRHSSSDKVRILRLFVHAHRLCAGLQTPSTFGATESGEVFGDACIKLHLPQQSGPSGRCMPSRRPVVPLRARRRRGKQRILRAHRSGPPGAAHQP
jgi:hypothetical protein